jgi:uncharacterized RDD family membrane protein YckC
VLVRSAGPPPPELTIARQGHYAGAASRLSAFAVDLGVAWGLFTLAAAAISFFERLVAGHGLHAHPLAAPLLYVLWLFLYLSYQWGLSGRTLGMATLGIQVVRSDGTPVNLVRALLRAVAFPLALLTLGIGFLGILAQRQRQAIYDLVADTVVVYSWDARAARLRWLARSDRLTAAKPLNVKGSASRDPLTPT